MRTVLASSNLGKAKEFDRLLQPTLEIERLPAGVLLPPETGTTFAANARLKAAAVADQVGGAVAVLADDSGLVVDSLDGEPGVRSARYAGEEATDEQNVAKLLHELGEDAERQARFVCALCLVLPDGIGDAAGARIVEVQGSSEGVITMEPRGVRGFGYDPVFQPIGWGLTLAEAEPRDKDLVSHRGSATRELLSCVRGILPGLGGESGVSGA